MIRTAIVLIVATVACGQALPPPGGSITNSNVTFSVGQYDQMQMACPISGTLSWDTNGCHTFGYIVKCRTQVCGIWGDWVVVAQGTTNSGFTGGHMTINFS